MLYGYIWAASHWDIYSNWLWEEMYGDWVHECGASAVAQWEEEQKQKRRSKV